MTDSDLTIRIGAQTDQASFAAAKAAVLGVKDSLAKTGEEIERSKSFDNAAKAFVQMSFAENNAAKAAANLTEEFKKLGATDKEIDRTVLSINKEIATLQRAETAATKKAAAAIEAEKRISDVAAREFAKELERIQKAEAAAAAKAKKDIERAELVAQREAQLRKASLQNKIDQDDSLLQQVRQDLNPSAAAPAQGTSLGRLLQVAGREGRALPAVAIPGTGVSTDAVSKIVGLSGALVDVAGKSSLATGAISLLTPVLGATTAATLGALAPVALLVAAFAGLGLALKALADSANGSAENIKRFAEEQRKASDRAAEGQTSKQVQEEAEKLDVRRKSEAATLATLQKAYADADNQLKDATIAGVNVGNGFRNLSRIISGDEQSLADQIAASEKIIADTSAEYNTLTGSIEDGAFAANDAAEAEKLLAAERSKNALLAADNAGQELASQQKALSAAAEQNEKRLKSIDEEEAVINRQIDVLTASGVTSEEVTAKIAALKNQLGLLGKESSFISDTALEASRAADAAKKAKEEQEKAAKEIEKIRADQLKADTQFTNKQVDLDRQSRDKVADIRRGARDKTYDTDLKYFRDTVKLAEEAREDEAQARRKFDQDELKANRDANRRLSDLRDEAIDDEQEAVNSRNFLEAARVRESLEKQNKEVLKEGERGREDRLEAAEIEAQERYEELNKARKERLNALTEERIDNKTNLNRQLREQQIQAGRQLDEALLAYNRETEARKAHLLELGVIDQQFYTQQKAMALAATNGGSTQAGMAAATASGTVYTPIVSTPLNMGGIGGGLGGGNAGSMGGLRPIPVNNSLANRPQVNIYANTSKDVIDAVRELGFID